MQLLSSSNYQTRPNTTPIDLLEGEHEGHGSKLLKLGPKAWVSTICRFKIESLMSTFQYIILDPNKNPSQKLTSLPTPTLEGLHL